MIEERLQPFIRKVGTGPKGRRDLTPEEATEAMRLLVSGQPDPVQIGAFLLALRIKYETPEELVAFTKVLRTNAEQIYPRHDYLLDVGTTYDGKHDTIQVLPIAAFIAAGAGVGVVLHGAGKMPVKYGVSVGEVLGCMGAPEEVSPATVEKLIEEVGVGYLHVPQHLPLWAELREVRASIGLRPVLAVIEKLWNLANAPCQIVACFHGPYMEKLPAVLTTLGCERGLLVQGLEGSADLGVGRRNKMIEVNGGEARELTLDPADYGWDGLKDVRFDELTAQHNARVALDVLDGRGGPASAAALLNAGVMVWVAGKAGDVEEGIALAAESLRSGAALDRLERFRRVACEA